MVGAEQFVFKNRYSLLLAFIILWITINLLQGFFIGLDEDEAYYWVYSQNLQWGYFDHPPMVALAIKFGELFGHSTLNSRLLAIFFSGATIFFAFKALPQRLANIKTYIFVFASISVFHLYGFVVTPDSFLLFFTALFFYAYRLYLSKDDFPHTAFLAFCIVGLLYCKYQGILPVFFTFLSNPKLIFKRSAWLVVLLTLVCYSPHLWWQYQNDWQSFRFHLFERMASGYRISKTTFYLIGQVLIWGPLTTILALFGFLKMRSSDLYMKAHYYCFWGILIFFFFLSFRSAVEAHWTLTAGVSFIVLLQQLILQSTPKFKKWFSILLALNIAMVVAVRILFFIPGSLARITKLDYMMYGKEWADQLYKITAGAPVVFIDSYGRPSLYQYYHRDVAVSAYNTVSYRKTYFSYSKNEALLNNKRVYVSKQYKMKKNDIILNNEHIPTRLQVLDSFKAVNCLKILWENKKEKMKPGDSLTAILTLINPGNQTIESKGLCVNYTFFTTRKEFHTSKNIVEIPDRELSSGYSGPLTIELKTPSLRGKYHLLFSVVQAPFDGSIASPLFDIVIK